MSEWKMTSLRDVAEIFDGPHATPTKTETGPWFLSISSLKQGQLDLTESAHLSDGDFKKWTRRVTPREGDVLFSYETRLGAAALMPTGIQACLGRRMGLLRPKADRAHSRFLLYSYLAPEFQQVIRERSIHGATVDRIPLVDLPDWPIRLPPLPEQQAISAALGALDDKIALNSRIVQDLDALTREIFRRDFPNFKSDGLPRGWREGTLADMCVTQYGYTASSVDKPTGPKFLRVKDINKQNWIEWDSVPHCTISESGRSKYSLAVGDVLVARMADPGKSAIVEESVDAVFASYLVRLKTKSLSEAHYVYGFLKSDEYSEYVAGSKGGSVQANMNAKVIVGARILIPPAELLEAYLARILPLRSRLIASLNESATLTELRDTLLPKLMAGEIRVRDAQKVVEDVT